MRRLILAGAMAAGSLLVAGVSPASACGDAPLVDGPVYVVVGDGGAWIYVESGEAAGLQKGGLTPLNESACDDGGAYDIAVF